MEGHYKYNQYEDNQSFQMIDNNGPKVLSDLDLIEILNKTIRLRISSLFSNSSNSTVFDETRMTFNQITFAVLISILVVADMLLVWSLTYIVMSYERRGQLFLKHHYAVLGYNSHSSQSQQKSA